MTTDEWVSSLMMTVAVCEQLEAAAAQTSTRSSAAALEVSASALRLLATDELEQTLNERRLVEPRPAGRG